MRVLGVDPGSRRIGLALSDEDGRLASPLGTIEGGDPERVARALAVEAERHAVERVVVGHPLALDGHEGDAARRARRLSERVRELTGLPVVLWDERLSTVSAERALAEAGVRGQARRARVDRAAAALVLQSYLDAQRGGDHGDGTDSFES